MRLIKLCWEIYPKLRPDLDFGVCDSRCFLSMSANMIVHNVNVCTRGQCHMDISRKPPPEKSDISL